MWLNGCWILDLVWGHNKFPSPSVYQLRKSWGRLKPEPRARVLCRDFSQLINVSGGIYCTYDILQDISLWILIFCWDVFSSRLCAASACNCGPCTGSPCMQLPKWLERLFSTCIRQLADGSGREPGDSCTSGPSSIPANADQRSFFLSLFLFLKN